MLIFYAPIGLTNGKNLVDFLLCNKNANLENILGLPIKIGCGSSKMKLKQTLKLNSSCFKLLKPSRKGKCVVWNQNGALMNLSLTRIQKIHHDSNLGEIINVSLILYYIIFTRITLNYNFFWMPK
jgi:hypothetical protein